MASSKRTKACQFSKSTKMKIYDRDKGCVFCRLGYHPPTTQKYERMILDVMHIVNRSQGGLGIEENGAIGCRYHHQLLDNGNKGLRAEMLEILEDYMRRIYKGWDRDSLIYKK